MPLRLFCTLFLLLSVCAFPLYFSVAIGIFAVIWFADYYELIPLYFLHDMLYSMSLDRFYGWTLVMTVCACVMLLISAFVKKQLFDTPLGRL